ncbi:MAG TPA: biotin/lipoate A/B protein ligase family protein [Anaerolineae bacterium]|nr:biotin/lipoate A/B protein ligase family protein [Anaerolineae bacterium]
MKPIRWLDLGTIPALRSQTVYHAVAQAMTAETPDTIILVSPAQPYVCIGYHQDLEKEVDLAYCQAHQLPVFRREVGGGAVYLDEGQVFTQWIFHRDHLPLNLEHQFDLYIRPLVQTYQALGVNAYFRPVNDIHVDGKKIGGTGAAQIGAAQVVVGSLMFDFNKATMARVLKVPSEKMRDKIFESLAQYMTTLREQLDPLPDRQAVKALYRQKCAAVLGTDIVAGEWTAAEEAMAVELDRRFTSDAWLFQTGGLRQTGVKIHEDVRVVEGAFKAPGGLIRVTARLREDRIDDLTLSGDFTMLPASGLGALEQAGRGLSPTRELLVTRMQGVYQSLNIQSPGLSPEHFAEAILLAKNGS